MVWAQMPVAKPLIETLDPLSVLLYDSQEALSLSLPQSLPVSVMLDQLDTGVAMFPKHLITVIHDVQVEELLKISKWFRISLEAL